MAGRIAAGRGLAITYKMQVQQPTKTFCNFMQKRLAKNIQVKQSKAYQIIRQLNKELSGMGLITVPGRVDANYFKKKLFYEEK